jgi:hypothetical protein
MLKNVEKEQRNYYLKELIEELNKNLPANAYIPIQSSNSGQFYSSQKSSFDKKGMKRKMTQKNRLHKVLEISTDYAFCLHSKERVPYHIIIKVAFTEDR